MSDTPVAAPAAPAAPAASSDPALAASAAQAAQSAQQIQAAKISSVPASTRKKYNLKVDGREEAFDFDPSDEAELIKHLQMSKAATKRMQETSELRQGVAELIQALQTDPAKVLADPRLNIPPEMKRKLAEAIMNNELEEMAKSPEQKEKERLQKEYENLKKQVEEEKKGREAAELRALTEQQAVHLDQSISSAIEKSGLPKNARTVRYFAEGLMFAVQNNLNLSAEDLIPTVKKQALAEFKELVTLMPDEEFESFLGKDQISRIRKRSIAKAKAAAANPATDIKSVGATTKQESTSSDKRQNMKDFLRGLGNF